jgi:hypothetical protein
VELKKQQLLMQLERGKTLRRLEEERSIEVGIREQK